MLTIGYFADGPWAHLAFDKLMQDESIVIKFMTLRYDKQDTTLIKLAQKYKIPVELSENVNSDEFLQRISQYHVDLFVSMSFNQIFKRRTFELPEFKTINCHAGKLPFYRGRNILNWVLINDEKEFGITVHYVDDGIDTGDIILQKVYPISDEDDYSTLLNKAYVGCADILYEAIKKIQNGTVVPIKQDTIDKVGMYCGIRCEGDEILNWNSTSREIFLTLFGLSVNQHPWQLLPLNGKPIKINKVKMIEGARSYIGKSGQIIGKTENGFYVKTADTFVEVVEFEFDGKIRVGDRML